MPSDASIYGLIRPQPIVPLRDPQEMALRRMQLQNAERTGRMGDLQLRETEADIARGGQLRDLFTRETNPSPEQVMAIDPVKLGPAYLKQRGDAVKGEQELLTKDRENYVALAAQAFRERQTIRTPEEWARHRDNLLASAGMFKTKEMRDFAMRTVAALPAQYDPQFIARSLAEGKEVFTPKMTERTDGARKWMEDTNPFTNPAILRGSEAKVQMSPSEKDASSRGWATLNQPVWSEDRGAFIPRPGAGGGGMVTGSPRPTVPVGAGGGSAAVPGAPIVPPNLPPRTGKAFEQEDKLRSDYTANPMVKSSSELQNAFNLIETAYKRPSAANDLAMATKYMKILDPTSVVRESEFALAVNATGLIDKVQNYAASVMEGKKLNPAQRKDFYDSAKAINDAFQAERQKVDDQYAEMATGYGLNPKNVIPRLRTKETTPKTPPPPKLGERKDGYIYKGGDPSKQSSWEKT